MELVPAFALDPNRQTGALERLEMLRDRQGPWTRPGDRPPEPDLRADRGDDLVLTRGLFHVGKTSIVGNQPADRLPSELWA